MSFRPFLSLPKRSRILSMSCVLSLFAQIENWKVTGSASCSLVLRKGDIRDMGFCVLAGHVDGDIKSASRMGGRLPINLFCILFSRKRQRTCCFYFVMVLKKSSLHGYVLSMLLSRSIRVECVSSATSSYSWLSRLSWTVPHNALIEYRKTWFDSSPSNLLRYWAFLLFELWSILMHVLLQEVASYLESTR